MIPTSRNRGYSEETIIDTAVVITARSATIRMSPSQVQVGVTPNARMNANTTTRFGPRLNTLVSTTDSGMTSRGNWVLRTTASRLTIEPTAVEVASWKK